MRKLLFALLSLALSLSTTAFSQETREARRSRRGQAAGYASRDATVLSMMGWGVGLAVGIAALCALIENNEATSTSNNGGSTTH